MYQQVKNEEQEVKYVVTNEGLVLRVPANMSIYEYVRELNA